MNAPSTLPSKVRLSTHFLRSARLILNNDFQKVFANKTNLVGKYMVIWFADGIKDTGLRLGVVASKRTFRRAVDRNRAKRLLREAFRLNKSNFNIDRDLVIVARKRILDVKCQDVEQELLRLLNVASGRGQEANGRERN